jgi:DNA-binding transcriptional LysR family regulator
MNLGNLNLNLLTVLDAVLRERSVTGAAARLGLSQPAVSASLARLRRHFDDQLLVRNGNAYDLTPLGEQLVEPVAAALAQIERVFETSRAFQPAESDRVFSVLASDYVLSVLGGAVSRSISARAPRCRIDFHPHTPSLVERAEPTLREVDAIVLPHGFVTDLPHVDLFSDSWVAIVDADNSAVDDVATLEQLVTSPWVVTYRSLTAFTPPMRQFEALGADIRIQAVVEHFLAIPPLIVGTDRVALVQTRLVENFLRTYPVRAVALPFAATPLVESLWWHPTRDADPAHRWLRSVFLDAARRVSAIDA